MLFIKPLSYLPQGEKISNHSKHPSLGGGGGGFLFYLYTFHSHIPFTPSLMLTRR